MLARIEEETRQHHGSADGQRLRLLEIKDEPAYAALLARIAGFEQPIEAALAATALEPKLGLTHFRTDRLAAHDLPAVGVAPELAFPTPTFAGEPEALGWMYVLQRNTLVHGLATRQLELRLPGTMARASAYLRAFDGACGARMFELGQVLAEVARSSQIADRIVLGAHEAFRAQRHWYSNVSRERRLTPPSVPLFRAA